MKYISQFWKPIIAQTLTQEVGVPISEQQVVLNIPPNQDKGDIAFPMFPYKSYTDINLTELSSKVAQAIEKHLLENSEYGSNHKVSTDGAYVNIHLDRVKSTKDIISSVLNSDQVYGKQDKTTLSHNKRIMIEFSAPNTNKPLHLGHLRNNILGESMSRILNFNGFEVRKVNLVNDRGVHICKSMLAYQKFGNGDTPESTGIKSDHFVGQYYVKYAQWEKEWIDEHGKDSLKMNASPLSQAQQMLQLWEQGDATTISLWKQMNTWALEGMASTYHDTNISFNTTYYESETYMLGKSLVLEGLKNNVFTQDEEGTIWLSLESIGLDNKVLLRSDGTSVYITQDLGTAFKRYEDWQFDTMIYVVAHEQNYHFKVLFHALTQLQFAPAVSNKMIHLGYGMVHLPDGRMKSREGTVVDADTLLNEVSELVKNEIIERNREEVIDDINNVSKSIALGAIHFYLLNTNPKKDITFDINTSIQFLGNTGPYIQYSCARINSLLKKFGDVVDYNLVNEWGKICSDEEWDIVMLLDNFPTIIEQVVQKHDPSILVGYLYKLSSSFSTFYQNTPIATEKDNSTRIARICISQAVLQVLKQGLYLSNIPYLESM